jgi:hypothetical protein
LSFAVWLSVGDLAGAGVEAEGAVTAFFGGAGAGAEAGGEFGFGVALYL